MPSLMLLPPFGIARLGSAPDPVVNYTLELLPTVEGSPARHQLKPAETIFVERDTGRVLEIRTATEEELTFKMPNDRARIRPVAPFFEVWILPDDEDKPRLLTQDDVEEQNLTITWDVSLGNWKAFRRTGTDEDKIVGILSDHPHTTGVPREVLGKSDNFLTGATISLGHFQCLLTDDDHRGIRARFLPPAGKIYGPPRTGDDKVIPVLKMTSPWRGHVDPSTIGNPPLVVPPGTFAHPLPPAPISRNPGPSRGYLDDTSDGIITVRVTGPNLGTPLEAKARMTVGPPDFAPDRLPFRSVADDFTFFEFGPEASEVVPDQFVVDLVERAYDSAELMQLNQSRIGSGFPSTPASSPDDAREAHHDLYADARKLVDEQVERGIFRNRSSFLGRLREPGSDERRNRMPLFMVGQNRGPLFLNTLQHNMIRTWSEQELGAEPPGDGNGGQGDDTPVDAAQARADMLALIRKKRDADYAARRHRRVRIGTNDERLSDLFDDEEALLEYLLNNDPVRNFITGLENASLISPHDLERSVFYQLIVNEDEGVMFGEFEPEEIRVIERWIMSL